MNKVMAIFNDDGKGIELAFISTFHNSTKMLSLLFDGEVLFLLLRV